MHIKSIISMCLFMCSISAFSDTQSSFIEFLHHHITQANAEITKERQALLALKSRYEQNQFLTEHQLGWLLKLAGLYRIPNFKLTNTGHWDELVKRVDIIPAPLAIAQAAKESAWGQSRFALEGNNYFGQWCFTANCGIVPKRRALGAKHEVKRFSSPYQSVFAYLRNLNSHSAYHRVRHIRAHLRDKGHLLDGCLLAHGLHRYSERGEAYVKEVQSLINRHGLHRYRS